MAQAKSYGRIVRASSRTGLDSAQNGERLVGLGFRCWLDGYQSGTIRSWENCWTHYCRELGSRNARAAMTDLSSWVDSVRCHALRQIELCPYECPSFGSDETLAISLIAASAQECCPALRACAAALLGTDQVDPVLKTAARFAITLETSGVTFASDRRAAEPSAPKSDSS
jgi:hypothetical protein